MSLFGQLNMEVWFLVNGGECLTALSLQYFLLAINKIFQKSMTTSKFLEEFEGTLRELRDILNEQRMEVINSYEMRAVSGGIAKCKIACTNAPDQTHLVMWSKSNWKKVIMI